MMIIPPLKEFAAANNPNYFKGLLLTLDPGETTGFALMRDCKLIQAGQLHTKTLDQGFDNLNNLIQTKSDDDPIERIMCEDYKVYSWKTEQHNWAGLHTPKFIGMIHCLARLYCIDVRYQMAVTAKQFCDDDKLKGWGLYQPGQRHARDAIRHACYYTVFGK